MSRWMRHSPALSTRKVAGTVDQLDGAQPVQRQHTADDDADADERREGQVQPRSVPAGDLGDDARAQLVATLG